MTSGFIIFITENWLGIADNLIQSLLYCSKYKIEINCINFTKDFQNDRIISKTIHMPNPHFFNITKCKLIASINTSFDVALILDADMVVTKEIDNIFEDNKDRIQTCKCPLFAKHPHDPDYKHILARVTKKPQKMKWVYSNYLFTKNHIWFLQEALNIMNNITDNNLHEHFYPVPEEGVLNALLAEHEVDYDLGYNYFPNCYTEVVEYYFNKDSELGKKGEKHIQDCYLAYDCPVKVYAFHGHRSKDVPFAKSIVDRLKNTEP